MRLRKCEDPRTHCHVSKFDLITNKISTLIGQRLVSTFYFRFELIVLG
jgi:hypothetical protein